MYRLHGRALNHQVWMASLFSAQGAYLSIQAPSLLDDLRAWQLVQAWAHGQTNFSQVIEAIETTFGGCFVHSEWDVVMNPMYEVWEQEESTS